MTTASMSSDAALNYYSLEYSYTELCQATSNFDLSQQLGAGSYGAVFRGIRRDGTDVAIKVLELPDESGFEEEVRVLSKFRHPNLVILMGFARRDATRFLVYELLGGGDVYQRLKKSNESKKLFSWKERCSAAVDAACGLSHLHNSTPKVFHRDIKTANILLDRNGTAKMADFGLACLSHSQAQKVEKASGTPGYACPLYAKRSVVTEGSEVYSFGMVLLEMLTAQAPAVMCQSNDGSQRTRFLICEIHGSPDIAVSMADAKAQWPIEVAHTLASLALRCACDQEELRPDFAEIVNQLRPVRDFVPAQIELESHICMTARAPPIVHTRMYSQRRTVPPPARQCKSNAPMLPQPVPKAAAAKASALWSLKCFGADSFADEHSCNDLPRDSAAITQWQDIGSSLSTTLRVGRLFQDDFFCQILPTHANHVSREHFQIWAEPLHMPGVLEASTTSIPCLFFATNYSANGIVVNGVHYSQKGDQVQIHNGDKIAIPRIVTLNEGVEPTPLIQFRFDLSGSILRDTDFSIDGNAGTMGGA